MILGFLDHAKFNKLSSLKGMRREKESRLKQQCCKPSTNCKATIVEYLATKEGCKYLIAFVNVKTMCFQNCGFDLLSGGIFL